MRNTNNLRQDTSLLTHAVNTEAVIEAKKPQSTLQKVPARPEQSNQSKLLLVKKTEIVNTISLSS